MLKVSETCQVLMELLETGKTEHLLQAACPDHLSWGQLTASLFSSFPLDQNKGCS